MASNLDSSGSLPNTDSGNCESTDDSLARKGESMDVSNTENCSLEELKEKLLSKIPSSKMPLARHFIQAKDWEKLKMTISPAGSEACLAFNEFVTTMGERPSKISITSDNTQIPDLKFMKNLKEPLNIVVLGETGVGKSTFINGIANYLIYKSLEQAKTNGPTVLINSSFHLTDERLASQTINMTSMFTNDSVDDDNEDITPGQSSTQKRRSYLFQFGPEERHSFRIIDTPGFGDVRGVETDASHFENILDYISDYRKIHAFLILLKPDQNRLSINFKYCVNELLLRLHSSASRNIIFCFTNTRSTLYRPGATYSLVTQHIEKLLAETGIRIDLSQNSVFCFDNECFRFLSAFRHNIKPKNCEEDYSKSWEQSMKETSRLLNVISALPPHDTEKTLYINNVRNVIQELGLPLALMASAIEENIRHLNEARTKLEKLKIMDKELTKRPLHIKQLVLNAVELKHPITVCTSECCTTFETDETDEQMPIYTECHNPCNLIGRKYPVFDKKLPEELQQCASKIEEITLQINNLEKREDVLKKEGEKIRNSCATFVTFLKENCFMKVNDAYKEHVECLINEEKVKVQNGASETHLQRLEAALADYICTVEIMQDHSKNNSEISRRVRSEEVNEKIEELKNLEQSGKFLRNVQRLVAKMVRQQQINETITINIHDSYLFQ